MTLNEITGAVTTVIDQDGENLCDNTPCSSSPCRNDGLCSLQQTSSSGFECTCSAGYTGDTCDEDIDECSDGEQHKISVCFLGYVDVEINVNDH